MAEPSKGDKINASASLKDNCLIDLCALAWGKILNNIKRILISVWLIALYLFCIIIVVFSLSTYLFQEKLSTLIKTGKQESSNLVDHYCDPSTFNLNYHFQEHEPIPEKQVPVSSTPEEDESTKKGNDLLVRMACLPNTATELKTYSRAEILTSYKKWDKVQEAARKSVEKNSEVEGRIEALHKQLAELQDQDQEQEAKLEEDLIFAQGDLNRSEDAKREFDKFFEENPELSTIFIEIAHFRNFFKFITWIYPEFEYYWSFPQPILKINLIIFMGILGSLIFITIEFLKESPKEIKHSLIMYFFRPFLGMIVALAMYVMVKSGQSTISLNSDVDLSPFLLSFLGITSGMLAEQAYRQIKFNSVVKEKKEDEEEVVQEDSEEGGQHGS